jgi:hypothetical protein
VNLDGGRPTADHTQTNDHHNTDDHQRSAVFSPKV